MVNTEIRSIIFFAAEDEEALYCQQKHEQELTVAQIMNSLLENSDLNWRRWSLPGPQIWASSLCILTAVGPSSLSKLPLGDTTHRELATGLGRAWGMWLTGGAHGPAGENLWVRCSQWLGGGLLDPGSDAVSRIWILLKPSEGLICLSPNLVASYAAGKPGAHRRRHRLRTSLLDWSWAILVEVRWYGQTVSLIHFLCPNSHFLLQCGARTSPLKTWPFTKALSYMGQWLRVFPGTPCPRVAGARWHVTAVSADRFKVCMPAAKHMDGWDSSWIQSGTGSHSSDQSTFVHRDYKQIIVGDKHEGVLFCHDVTVTLPLPFWISTVPQGLSDVTVNSGPLSQLPVNRFIQYLGRL